MQTLVVHAVRLRRGLFFAVAAAGFTLLFAAAHAFGGEYRFMGLGDAGVRAVAHFCGYGSLAVLTGLALGRRYLAAWLVVMLLATTEEIRQLFIPFRFGSVNDWLMNLGGVTAFLVVAAVVTRMRGKGGVAVGEGEGGCRAGACGRGVSG